MGARKKVTEVCCCQVWFKEAPVPPRPGSNPQGFSRTARHLSGNCLEKKKEAGFRAPHQRTALAFYAFEALARAARQFQGKTTEIAGGGPRSGGRSAPKGGKRFGAGKPTQVA